MSGKTDVVKGRLKEAAGALWVFREGPGRPRLHLCFQRLLAVAFTAATFTASQTITIERGAL